MQEWFTPLNPYAERDPLLKIEAADYALRDGHITETMAPLFCYAVSSKRYALFNINDTGSPVLRKASAHGLGHLLPPYRDEDAPIAIPRPTVPLEEIGVERWQHDLWFRILEAALAEHPNQPSYEDLAGLDHPAVSRYAATTPDLLRWFKKYNLGKPYREQVRPFNFLLAYQAQPALGMSTTDTNPNQPEKPKKRKANCQNLPRAVSPYDRDHRKAMSLCFDRDTGQQVVPNQLKTYRRALAQYHLHQEAKFLDGDYT